MKTKTEDLILRAREKYMAFALNHTDEKVDQDWRKILKELNPENNLMVQILITNIRESTTQKTSDKAIKVSLIKATERVFILFEMIKIIRENIDII